MEREGLENSCRRLPELIKEDAPLGIIVAEFQLLSELAFAAMLKIHASQLADQDADKTEIAGQNKTIADFQELLSCRAGKLLLKEKLFIVVACDETYFTAVYLMIRESEKRKGRWTDACEQAFQEATLYDDESEFAEITLELKAILREQRKLSELQHERDNLQIQVTKQQKQTTMLRADRTENMRLRKQFSAIKTEIKRLECLLEQERRRPDSLEISLQKLIDAVEVGKETY